MASNERIAPNSNTPFWLGDYNSNYDNTLYPDIKHFHEAITNKRAEWKHAVDTNQSQDVVQKIINEGDNMRIQFLINAIQDCANKGIQTLPLHMELCYPIERRKEAQHELERRLANKGKLYQSNLLTSLRAAGANTDRNGTSKQRQFNEFCNQDMEHQYSLTGGDWLRDSIRTFYQVWCGPLRCGQMDERGRCHHGLVPLHQRPPHWIDGQGWEAGKNPFQIMNRDVWKESRYKFDDKTGRLIGPPDTGTDYATSCEV